MDTVVISITKQMDGVNFALDPMNLRELKVQFPGSQPIWKIFVAYDHRNQDMEFLYDKIKRYFIPVFIGVEDLTQLKKIKHLQFIDAATEKKLKMMDLN